MVKDELPDEDSIKVNEKERKYVLDQVSRWDYPVGSFWEVNDVFIKNMKRENKRNKW